MRIIETERLRLVEGTVEVLRADLVGPGMLARVLDCQVPADWPPELYPPEKVERRLRALGDPAEHGWWSWYAVEKASDRLVGMATYLGQPADGEVEVGYAICEDARRRGFATEALTALVDRAFATAVVERVFALTTFDRAASMGVLVKAGFRYVNPAGGPADEEWNRRFELPRERHVAGAPALDLPTVARWLERYFGAWERRDPDAAAALFTPDAVYRWEPFERVYRGRAAIREAWHEAVGGQREVRCGWSLVALAARTCTVRWTTHLERPNGTPRTIDGVLEIVLDGDGCCRSLREWWHSVDREVAGDRP